MAKLSAVSIIPTPERRRSSFLIGSTPEDISLTPAEAFEQANAPLQKSNKRSFSTESSGMKALSASGSTASYAEDYIAPIPTSKCLQNFIAVIRRQINPTVVQRTKQKELNWTKSRDKRQRYRAVLQTLRKWHEKQTLVENFSWRTLWSLHQPFTPPKQNELVELVQYYYPQRGQVKVYVCDFGQGRFEKTEVALGQVDPYLREKPDWAAVRWIHAPLNVSLVQSSLEERFLKTRRSLDPSLAYGRDASWPYAQIETISIRKYDDLLDMQDVYQILSNHHNHPAFSRVGPMLDETALDGIGEDLRNDVKWRASHWGRPITHWELALPDFQRQMSNSSAEWIDPDYHNHAKVKVVKQALSSCKFFENAQLIRSNFRCFHSADGFLLTLCADGGIDYIDKSLDQRLDKPSDTIFLDEEGSLIGHMLELFSTTGTDTWHKRDVNWFLIYLLTEIVAKPNNHRQGCNAPSLLKAYQNVVQDLKDHRYADFKRGESAERVRAYLACIDELTTMNIIWHRSMEMLQSLEVKAREMENDDLETGNPAGESALDRVIWARKIVEENEAATWELITDLQKSRDALFQLRSIEQNELAIVADKQNKAILIFTGVTIVFLPLSFFTSYFGMNLQGIVNTARTEVYFWKICGSIGLILILLVTLYVFRKKLAHQLRRGLGINSEGGVWSPGRSYPSLV